MKNINAQDSPEGQVRAVYLTMLSRQPRLEELEMWSASVTDNETMGIRDMIWTLANSVEFLFVK